MEKTTPKILSDFLRDIFFGNTNATLDIDSLEPDFAYFGEGLVYFAKCFFEYANFAKALAEGDLNSPQPPKDNSMAGSLKSLHASLRHLTWQTQQVANGDYTQRIDFMGEFAGAFNTMVVQLAEREDKLQTTVLQLQRAILKTMADMLEGRDGTTGGHTERANAYLAVLLAAIKNSGLYPEEVGSWDIDLVLQSSQLHDLGKIAIDDAVLKKPGRLTPEEFDHIKTHTTAGHSIIEKIKQSTTEHEFLDYAGIFALYHHEKWDGGGYPLGLAGQDIPLLGRLLALCDVYDALTSERPYKTPMPHSKALVIIQESSGTHFEPALVDLFIAHEKDIENVLSTFISQSPPE